MEVKSFPANSHVAFCVTIIFPGPDLVYFYYDANCILSDTRKLYPRRRLLNPRPCFSVGNLVVVCI
jgi:hypothetical protein